MIHINEFSIFDKLPNRWDISKEDGEKLAKHIADQGFEDEENFKVQFIEHGDVKIVRISMPSINDKVCDYNCVISMLSMQIIVRIAYDSKTEGEPPVEMAWETQRISDDLTWIDTFSRVSEPVEKYLGYVEEYNEIKKKMTTLTDEMSAPSYYPHGTPKYSNGKLINIMK